MDRESAVATPELKTYGRWKLRAETLSSDFLGWHDMPTRFSATIQVLCHPPSNGNLLAFPFV
jgi:hypothetical protein